MKPTPQLESDRSGQRKLPLSDHCYQSTLETARAVAGHEAEVQQTRAFWKLSRDVFAKTPIDLAHELPAFAVVSALSAWSIFAAMYYVTRLVRGY